MKRLLCLLLLLLTLPAVAEPAPTPLPGYTLLDTPDEVRVFAIPSSKANIVGYIIPGGQQEVDVLSATCEWCYVRFTSIYGDSYGYVPRACFAVETPATPVPVVQTSLPSGTIAFVRNAESGFRLNLRTGPSLSSTSLGKYYSGVTVTATGACSGGYAQVIIHDVLGWMDMRYLEASSAVRIETPLVVVDNPGSGINLRKGPGSDQPLIGWFPDGTEVIVMAACPDGWYHVEIGGKTGYVSGMLLSESFPFQYGTDSDNPAVNGDLTSAVTTLYVCKLSAGSHLNLRKTPSANASILGRFYNGTPMELISYTRTGWAYVRIGQLEGYMDADYLSDVKPTHYGQTRKVKNPYGTGMNLRDMPTTQGAVIGFLHNNTRVIVLGDLTENWCYVDMDGTLGYVLGTRLE